MVTVLSHMLGTQRSGYGIIIVLCELLVNFGMVCLINLSNASAVIKLKCYDNIQRSDEYDMTMEPGCEYFRESAYNCQH